MHIGNACGTTGPYEIACCKCMWHGRGNVDIHPQCFPSKQAEKGEKQSTLHLIYIYVYIFIFCLFIDLFIYLFATCQVRVVRFYHSCSPPPPPPPHPPPPLHPLPCLANSSPSSSPTSACSGHCWTSTARV